MKVEIDIDELTSLKNMLQRKEQEVSNLRKQLKANDNI